MSKTKHTLWVEDELWEGLKEISKGSIAFLINEAIAEYLDKEKQSANTTP